MRPVTTVPPTTLAPPEEVPPPPPVPALEMRGITKRYPGVVANDHIDLEIRPGEIHALLGENGAGKTTLMNVLYGLAVPDEGEILLDGKPVNIAGPSDAIARGIGMVHQHFMLVPVLTVAENIILGEETLRRGGLHRSRQGQPQIRELARAVRLRDRPRRQGRRRCPSASSSASRSSRRSIATRASSSSTSRRPCSRPGNRGDLRPAAQSRGERPQHRLHQPQALRGARDRRPDHRHPARTRRRRAGPKDTTRRTWPS